MEKEKVLNLVTEALNKSGGDESKAADILMAMAEDEPELMLEFLNHGVTALRAIAEGQLATKH
ncbi:hypothetical protein LCGC14_1763030 [marine sediment metagenome]|uniref:B12-binding N-terminal domain-containing protein n=1 Tax=marine sediment metagenome TaxID=412755 RepID=A0A0F9HMV1_9ZZZZ